MKPDLQKLIEEIRVEHQKNVESLIDALLIDDAVERFHSLQKLDSLNLDIFEAAIVKAKAITIHELRDQKLSFKAIGELFGLSAQRVHQLASYGGQEWQKKPKKAKAAAK